MNCDAALKALISTHLAGFRLHGGGEREGKAAAVALAIVDEAYGADLPGRPRHEGWQSRAALILTRRSFKLRSHPGQWALPGSLRRINALFHNSRIEDIDASSLTRGIHC